MLKVSKAVAIRTEHKALVIAVATALLVWVIYALLDYAALYPISVHHISIFDPKEVIFLSSISVAVIAGGFVISRAFASVKRLENKLQATRIYLSTIIETAPTCIKLLAPDSSLLFMNRAGLDMIEADTMDQIQGQQVVSLISEPYKAAFSSLTTSCFNGLSGSLEFEMTGLKGRRLWLETRAVPLLDDKGAIHASLGITRDITDNKAQEQEQAALVEELQDALRNVKTLRGFLPICAACKKIRDDRGYWKQIESYISDHSNAVFSHGICPDCSKRLYPDFFPQQ
jgi:PAS domain S-box-containing protein